MIAINGRPKGVRILFRKFQSFLFTNLFRIVILLESYLESFKVGISPKISESDLC